MRRHLVEIRLGDLDVVTEDGIESNLERGDAGARDFVRLQFGNPIFAAAHGVAKFVERSIEAVANHAAFLYGKRRGIHDGACNVVQASPIGCLFDFPPLFRTQLLVQTAQAAGKGTDHFRIHPTAGIGNNKKLNPEKFHHAHRKCHFLHGITFVEMKSALHGNYTFVSKTTIYQASRMTFNS